MKDVVTQIRVLAEEHIIRHQDTPVELILGDAEYAALEKWSEEHLTFVQDPTLIGVPLEFMGMKVHRTGRPRGIRVK